ncbi:hypothetical protein LWI29_030703 [Acer saccharum]|uniref:Zinc finger PMZ-type domain-containing protein n=1 Tax=Acer saccharum TaxID=4024 RepID=A0AA39SYP7_ACESA|nr:hypothetical protein LWI29_030703 [Acer saccharum]
MSQQLRTDTNVDASIWQYYRARTRAKKLIQGSIKDLYSKLWEYCAEVRRMNPGSSVILKCSLEDGDANPKFMRLYICLHALKKGWKEGCGSIIGLDGCFIKGYHTRQLLTAIGVDPNNQMYPITYALVESECRDSWEWFLELLGQDLEINNSYGIVWIMDKQKGLINAIAQMFPNSEHRFCVRHMYNNFKSEHKSLLFKQILWVAAKCTIEQGKCAQAKENMRSESVAAYEWLVEKDPVHWSRAYLKDTAVVERLKLESNICHPKYNGNFHYQVSDPGDDQHIVDIDKKTCACNRWQLTGIPCIYGISALLSSNRDPIDYLHNKYKKENFIKAYAPVIYGINGPMMWPKTNDKPLECPLFKKQKGRPKKARALQADEVRV